MIEHGDSGSGLDAQGQILQQEELFLPLKQGWLSEPSRGFLGRFLWKKVWVSCTDAGLRGCKDPQDDGEPLLTDSLAQVDPLANAKDGSAVMFGLELRGTAPGSSCRLFSRIKEERDAWLQALTMRARAAATGGCRVKEIFTHQSGSVLGTGAFSTVVQGVHLPSNQPCAIKVVHTSMYQKMGHVFQKEHTMLESCSDHPNIATLIAAYSSPSQVLFAMEICAGGELVRSIASDPSYSERTVQEVVRQLGHALAHIHRNGIVHLDLKPENILVKAWQPKPQIVLVDFGLASFFHTPMDPGGTYEFLPHDLAINMDAAARNGTGPEADMWSLGCIIYYLLSGRTPFLDSTPDAILQRIQSGQWKWRGEQWATVSTGAKELIYALLQVDRRKRLTAQQLLQHPWVVGCAPATPLAAARSTLQQHVALSSKQRGDEQVPAEAFGSSFGDG